MSNQLCKKVAPWGGWIRPRLIPQLTPFFLLKVLFSMWHLLSYTVPFSSFDKLTQLAKVIQPSLEECHPKGVFQKLCFSAGDKTECIMVSMALQFLVQDRHHCYYRYCRKMCYFLLSCLVDQCHWGNVTAWFVGGCPILYAGTS